MLELALWEANNLDDTECDVIELEGVRTTREDKERKHGLMDVTSDVSLLVLILL